MRQCNPFLHTVYMALTRQLHTRALASSVTSRDYASVQALHRGRPRTDFTTHVSAAMAELIAARDWLAD